jgi:hypothetical protein
MSLSSQQPLPPPLEDILDQDTMEVIEIDLLITAIHKWQLSAPDFSRFTP